MLRYTVRQRDERGQMVPVLGPYGSASLAVQHASVRCDYYDGCWDVIAVGPKFSDRVALFRNDSALEGVEAVAS